MKKYFILMFASAFLVFACSGESSDKAAPEAATDENATADLASNGKYAKAEIAVPTIQCKSCVANVEAGIKEVEGVKEYKVDLDTKTAFVLYDDSMTDVLSIEKSIALEGYNANDTMRDMDAYNDLDKCCQLPEDESSQQN